MPLQKNQMIRLSIDGLSSDGSGVGRYEGQVVFVPGAAVADVLDVKLVKLAKTHAFGIIHQVVTPGPGRQKVDCPIAGRCGGCAFRHLSYEAELEAKQGFVQNALRRIGHLDVPVLPTLPSPLENRYRNKVQYPVAAGKGGTLVYGFYAPRSHRVVPCEDCLLQPLELNEIAASAAALLEKAGAPPYNEETGTGLVRHIILRQSAENGAVLLGLVLTKSNLNGGEAFVAAMLQKHPEIETVVLNHNPANTNVILGKSSRVLYGGGTIKDSLLGVPMRLDIHSFAQVNHAAAGQLFATAAEYAAPTGQDTLLDLYCGTGVIGLSMAHRCKQLIGVEVVPQAVESAKANAAEMGLENTRFICADAKGAVLELEKEGLAPDIITLDPPRKGVDGEALKAVLAMAPRRIVMVSCNAATLARDLRILCDGGYRLQRVQPADLFPRTKHVECVCLLTKGETAEG